MKIGLLAIAAASLLLSNPANTAEIKVLASGAIKEAYLELIPQFKSLRAQGRDDLGRHRRHQEAHGRG